MIPSHMTAVYLTGHGGFEALSVRDDVAVPSPGVGQVLIEVRAAGINNTDINTRTGWYSKAVRGDTNAAAEAGYDDVGETGDWSGAGLQFPRIQGGRLLWPHRRCWRRRRCSTHRTARSCPLDA